MNEPSLPNERLPISVITGFLGSGKTTLLAQLVRRPELANVAVVINEFGEVGLDHLLVEKSSENTVLLDSGCLCCTVRGDLIDTLRGLFIKRVRGSVPPFDRVVIETTGLADPAPILHTLMTDPLISARFRLDGVIATVDAVHGSAQIDRHTESLKQAAMADRLVLTKTDIAPPDAAAALRRRLARLNPGATLVTAVAGAVAPADLFNAGLYDPTTKTADVAGWLNAAAYEDAAHDHDHDHGPDCAGDACDHPDHHHGHHDAAIASFCLTYDEPLDWEQLVTAVEMLIAAHGPDLLRIKGILNVVGSERPVAIHGVQHVFHPPAELDAWPDADRRSKIVFITHNLGRPAVQGIMDMLLRPVPAA